MIDEDNPVISFNAQDRCDRCGAQAYSCSTRFGNGSDLFWCIHHAKEFRDALLDSGWTMIDDLAGIENLNEQEKAMI